MSSPIPVVAVLRSKHTTYLLLTSLLGRLPSAMAALAIVQLVQSATGDFAFAGGMTAVYVVASAVGQPILGRFVDRVGQVRVISFSGIVSSLALIGLATSLVPLPEVAIFCAVLAGFSTPPLEPALRVRWPRLVAPGPHLKAAFSLDAGAQEIIFILGPLLTVIGITAFGPAGNLFFAAALGLLGALAFVLNPAPRGAPTTGRCPRGRSKNRSPILHSAVARVAIFTFGLGMPIGALTITATATEAARDAEGLAGWILAANATGALIGAIVVGIRPLRYAPARLLTPCGILLAVGYMPLAIVALPTWSYLLAAVLSGVMLPATLGQVFERITQISPAAVLTEANGWVISAMTLGIGASTLAAGLAVGTFDTPAVIWCTLTAAVVTIAVSFVVAPPR